MTRTRKVLLSMGRVALLIGGAVTIVPPLLWGDHVDYSHVASIKGTREYQDRVLLEKAWALPVAALYRADIDFQSNASWCGPASIGNVLLSLHRPGDQSTTWKAPASRPCWASWPVELSRPPAPRERRVAALRDQFHARSAVWHRRRAPLADRGLPRRRRPGAGARREQGIWPLAGEIGAMYDAMNTLDTGAQKKRGLLLIE